MMVAVWLVVLASAATGALAERARFCVRRVIEGALACDEPLEDVWRPESPRCRPWAPADCRVRRVKKINWGHELACPYWDCRENEERRDFHTRQEGDDLEHVPVRWFGDRLWEKEAARKGKGQAEEKRRRQPAVSAARDGRVPKPRRPETTSRRPRVHSATTVATVATTLPYQRRYIAGSEAPAAFLVNGTGLDETRAVAESLARGHRCHKQIFLTDLCFETVFVFDTKCVFWQPFDCLYQRRTARHGGPRISCHRWHCSPAITTTTAAATTAATDATIMTTATIAAIVTTLTATAALATTPATVPARPADGVTCPDGRVCTTGTRLSDVCIVFSGPECEWPCSTNFCLSERVTGEYECPTRNCSVPPSPSPSPPKPQRDWLAWAGVIALVHFAVALGLLTAAAGWTLRRGGLRGFCCYRNLLELNDEEEQNDGMGSGTPMVSVESLARTENE